MLSSSTDHLGSQSITRLFLGMALPIALGMSVHGLYNIVDAIFVTRALGANAMGGISIVFPVQMLVFAIATLIGSGMASIVARYLGAKQTVAAQTVIDMAIRLALGTAVLLTLIIANYMHDLLAFLGVSDVLMPYAIDYLWIITVAGIPITLLAQIPADALRAEGKAMLMMVTMVLSSLLNIVLDAVFIFGLEMGVEGAAYATVISQFVALAVSLSFFLRGKTQLRILPFSYGTRTPILNEILVLGIPIFISHAGVSIFIGVANYSLAHIPDIDNDLYISAYGLIGRIMIFAILPVIAMTIALQTIAGYNYGAQQYERVRQCINIGFIATLTYGACISVMVIIFPNLILGIFTNDPELISATAVIGFWVFLCFPFANAYNLGSALFQALGKAREAIFLSALRIYFLLLPSLLILPKFGGLSGIWFAFPLADIISFGVVLLLFHYERRRLIYLHSAESSI